MRTHSVNSNALAFKLFRNKKTLNLLTSVVQIHFININNSIYRAKKNPENILSFQKIFVLLLEVMLSMVAAA